MSLLDKTTNRLQALADRERFETDLDDEMRFHLEMEIEENIKKGMSRESARFAAMRSFTHWIAAKLQREP